MKPLIENNFIFTVVFLHSAPKKFNTSSLLLSGTGSLWKCYDDVEDLVKSLTYNTSDHKIPSERGKLRHLNDI